MASSASHTIRLKGNPIRDEALAGGAITPGHLLMRNSSDQFVVHNNAGGPAVPIFAAENEVFGGDIDDAYASSDNVLAWRPSRGDEIYALVPASAAAIVVGDRLESNGDGTLRKASDASVSVSTGAVTDDDSAASNGTQVYVHLDDLSHYANPTCHLESVTAGNADTDFDIGASGPTVRVRDDNAAATGGIALYFDEDAANPDSRFMINNTVTGQDVFLIATNGSAIRIVHNADAATDGVIVYIDDDGTNEEDRLLFVSPTNADGAYQTDDLVGWGISEAYTIAEASEAVDNSAGGSAARIRVIVT